MEIQSVTSAPSLQDCRTLIVEELADLRAQSLAELETQLADPGHRIDSQEAECVIATLEEKHGVSIPQVEEISGVRVLTLQVLVDHVQHGWCVKKPEGSGSPA